MKKSSDFPGWPDGRNLKRYEEITGFNFSTEVSAPSWIDIGCGKGTALTEWLNIFPAAKAIGIDTSANVSQIKFDFIKATLPGDLEGLRSLRHSADIVTDVYGPSSYSNNPELALLCSAFLTKINAVTIVLTHAHRFGKDDENLTFMANVVKDFGVSFKWERINTLSDSANHPIQMLRITLSPKFELKDQILQEAKKLFGNPIQKDPVWSSRVGGSAKIYEVDYVRRPNSP